MKFVRTNLLGRDLVFEAMLTVDSDLEARVAMSVLDETAPYPKILETLVVAGRRLMKEAERLAEQHGYQMRAAPDGSITVTKRTP